MHVAPSGGILQYYGITIFYYIADILSIIQSVKSHGDCILLSRQQGRIPMQRVASAGSVIRPVRQVHLKLP